MARWFVQQPDYKNKNNFMAGSVHRLITVGTPHFGGNLSKILDDHSNELYCFDLKTPQHLWISHAQLFAKNNSIS